MLTKVDRGEYEIRFQKNYFAGEPSNSIKKSWILFKIKVTANPKLCYNFLVGQTCPLISF